MKKLIFFILFGFLIQTPQISVAQQNNTESPIYLTPKNKTYLKSGFSASESDNYKAHQNLQLEFGRGVNQNTTIYIGGSVKRLHINDIVGALSDYSKPYVGGLYRIINTRWKLDGQLEYAFGNHNNPPLNERDEIRYKLRIGQQASDIANWSLSTIGLYNYNSNTIKSSTDYQITLDGQVMQGRDFSIQSKIGYNFFSNESEQFFNEDNWFIAGQTNWHMDNSVLLATFIEYKDYKEILTDEITYGIKVNFQF